MLMITHTWVLKEFLGAGGLNEDNLDLFTYNIVPDILCFHKTITPELTHGISRFRILPSVHKKASFVHFHLLTDDIAHYGKIGNRLGNDFIPDSDGYSYVKGRQLIQPVHDFHKSIGNELSYSQTAYRAHIIIEMAFDLLLYEKHEARDMVNLFYEALNHTVDYKISGFSRTLEWLYGIERAVIIEAMQQGLTACTLERINSFMNMEGRICLYIDKFGLDKNDDHTRTGIRDLMLQGMALISDYKEFIYPTFQAIRDSGFINPL